MKYPVKKNDPKTKPLLASSLLPTKVNTGGLATRAVFHEPDKKILFYASDRTNSNQQIEEIIASSGFEPFNIGVLTNLSK